MMFDEFVEDPPVSWTVRKMRSYEKKSNTLQFIGILTAIGSIITLTEQPANLVAMHCLQGGLALFFVATIISMGLRSLAEVADDSLIAAGQDNRIRTIEHRELIGFLTPRKAAIFGALLMASGMIYLSTTSLHSKVLSPGSHFYTATGIIAAGMCIMVISAAVAFYRDKIAYREPFLFFNSSKGIKTNTIAMGGLVTAGSGTVLMRAGVWSPGVNMALVGVSFMLGGLILDSFISMAYEQGARKPKFTGDAEVEEFNSKKYKLGLTILTTPIGATVAAGGAVVMLHKALSSPDYAPSFAGVDMCVLLVGATSVLASILYGEWVKQRLDQLTASNDYVCNART